MRGLKGFCSLFGLLMCTLVEARYVEDNDYSVNARTDTYQDTHYSALWGANFKRDILEDYKNYFLTDQIKLFAGSVVAGGLLANTKLDQQVADHWQKHIRTQGTDRLFKAPQTFGGFSYFYAPLYLMTMAAGHLKEQTEWGNVLYHWGYRSFRTFLLGGPQQAFLTYAFGSGRPNHPYGSKWHPFKHCTGVSGHAFYGAIPFVTAAMMSESPLLKYTLYAVSTLPGLSRINSNYHYLSQVLLGWTFAYLSGSSVYATDEGREPKFQMRLQSKSDGWMLYTHLNF